MTNHPSRKRGPYTAEMFGPIWAQGPIATFDRIRDARKWAEDYGDIGARSCEIRDAKGQVVGRHSYSPDGWFRAEAGDPAGAKTVRPGSKLEIVVGLLKRSAGCTTAEALAATGWPAISFNQQAKAAGIALRKEKEGKVTRYYAA